MCCCCCCCSHRLVEEKVKKGKRLCVRKLILPICFFPWCVCVRVCVRKLVLPICFFPSSALFLNGLLLRLFLEAIFVCPRETSLFLIHFFIDLKSIKKKERGSMIATLNKAKDCFSTRTFWLTVRSKFMVKSKTKKNKTRKEKWNQKKKQTFPSLHNQK